MLLTFQNLRRRLKKSKHNQKEYSSSSLDSGYHSVSSDKSVSPPICLDSGYNPNALKLLITHPYDAPITESFDRSDLPDLPGARHEYEHDAPIGPPFEMLAPGNELHNSPVSQPIFLGHKNLLRSRIERQESETKAWAPDTSICLPPKFANLIRFIYHGEDINRQGTEDDEEIAEIVDKSAENILDHSELREYEGTITTNTENQELSENDKSASRLIDQGIKAFHSVDGSQSIENLDNSSEEISTCGLSSSGSASVTGTSTESYESNESGYDTFISGSKRQELFLISLLGKLQHSLRTDISIDSDNNGYYGETADAADNFSRTGSAFGSNSSDGSKALSNASSKRKLANSGEDENENENDQSENRRRKKSGKASNTALSRIRKFACPYHKRDPTTFNADTGFGACSGAGWTEISKLKEHLYRRHHHLLQCQRCKLPFSSQYELDRHAESLEACQPRVRLLRDGFLIEEFLIIHKKKKSFPGQDDAGKWREIYQILFPNERVPSPYVEIEPELLSPHPRPGNVLSPTNYFDFAFPEEFERRATALVANTIRPFELNLSETVDGLAQDSRDAVFDRYQTMTSGFEASLADLDTPITQQGDRSWMGNIANPATDFDLNTVFDPWITPSEGSRGYNSYSLRPSSSSSSSRPCACVGKHNCTTSTNRQTAPSMPVPNVAPLVADGAVMDLLQHMTRSILALEKRLEAKENTTSPS